MKRKQFQGNKSKNCLIHQLEANSYVFYLYFTLNNLVKRTELLISMKYLNSIHPEQKRKSDLFFYSLVYIFIRFWFSVGAKTERSCEHLQQILVANCTQLLTVLLIFFISYLKILSSYKTYKNELKMNGGVYLLHIKICLNAILQLPQL